MSVDPCLAAVHRVTTGGRADRVGAVAREKDGGRQRAGNEVTRDGSSEEGWNTSVQRSTRSDARP